MSGKGFSGYSPCKDSFVFFKKRLAIVNGQISDVEVKDFSKCTSFVIDSSRALLQWSSVSFVFTQVYYKAPISAKPPTSGIVIDIINI